MAIYYTIILALLILQILSAGRPATLLLGETMGWPKHARSKVVQTAVSFGLVALVMGLRATTVGVDTVQYQRRFMSAWYMLTEQSYRSELGYTVLNLAFRYIGADWQVFLAATATLTCACIGYFVYRHSPSVPTSAVLYITIGLFTMSMSGIRQMLAVALCLLGLSLLLKNRGAWFFALVGAAFTIHNSAVVFLPMWLLRRARLKRASVFILIIGASASVLLRNPLVALLSHFRPSRYLAYELFGGYNLNPLLAGVVVLIPLFCLLVNKDYDVPTGRFSSTTSVLFAMSCLGIFFTMLAYNSGQIGRLAYYFTTSNVVLIPASLAGVPDKYLRALLALLILSLCVLYFVISTPGGTLRIDSYSFFWQ
ncbi:MAG: EpsG family protein [Coriobacteriia bacterium]